MIAAAVALAPRHLRAREYALPFGVDAPEDLEDLARVGELEGSEVETLAGLMEQPVDLNRADRALLFDLPGVTNELALAIVAHRREHGPFRTPDDLRLVPGMTPAVLELVLPFITIAPAAPQPGGKASDLWAVESGALWRHGGGKSAAAVDRLAERAAPPQGFLRLRGGGRGLAAGAVASYRERTRAWWDAGRGQLVSDGPASRIELDRVYAHGSYGPIAAILGSFDLGFGERLTFDTSSHRDPSGWYALDRVHGDGERGQLWLDGGLFGAAATVCGPKLAGGLLRTTLFGSRQVLEAYQYGVVSYGYDRGADPSCVTDSDCAEGYACDEVLGACRSSRLYAASARAVDPVTGGLPRGYRHVTFADAFRETLFGGNLTYGDGEAWHLCVTAYRGHADILLAREAQPRFSPAARYPENGRFGAVGASARAAVGSATLSGEYALTGGGGHAAYGRLIVPAGAAGEASLALRYYDARYENPRGRGEAAPDLELGLAARNEAGARLRLVVAPVSGPRLSVDADLWRPVQRVAHGAAGGVVWRRLPGAARLRLAARVSYQLTRRDATFVVARYDGEDLGDGGGDQSEEASRHDAAEGGVEGTRHRIEAGGWTKRIPGLQLAGSATFAGSRGGRDAGLDRERSYRLRAVVPIPGGGSVVGSAAAWRHARRRDGAAPGGSRRHDGSLDVAQRLGERLELRARYGVTSYHGERPGRLVWYHLAKLSLRLRF